MSATWTDETIMKIQVSRVPAEGLKEQATYEPSLLDMERDDIHIDGAFEVDAFITKVDEELVVDVDIHCPLRLTCARCLEEFRHEARADTIFSYTVGPTDVVDITEDVRQEVILTYPMIPVCQPECKGLCHVCGRNLNVDPCSHQVGTQHKPERS